MGKLYTIEIENIYSGARYNITSFGIEPRAVHKHVLLKAISQSERIVKMFLDDRCVFQDSTGFISKK